MRFAEDVDGFCGVEDSFDLVFEGVIRVLVIVGAISWSVGAVQLS